MVDERSDRRDESRRVPQWISQRRSGLAVGGIIGLAGIGGAFAIPADEVSKSPQSLSTTSGDAGKSEQVKKEVRPEWTLPNLEHERVDYWVDRFTYNPDMREKMEGFLERSGRYVPMLIEKLDERDMPRDLIYLAMIESGFQPEAYSHAHASGLWQFIAETGQRYGLEIDRAVDERNDPVRSTEAALDYLQYMHERFDSWYLAAAGYNSGENRVARIMRETFGQEKARSEQDYYRIWSQLPSETRDYVPLMMAAARIAKDPAKYGFDHVEPVAPLEYDEVMMPPATQLADIADAAGVSVDAIKELNPHFKLNRTPNNRDYPVRIPAGSLRQLAANWGLEIGPEVRSAVGE